MNDSTLRCLQKVNEKNAFEVEFNPSKIKQFAKSQKPGKKWTRTGEAIDATAKVYGYRVDNVLNDAWRMRLGMQRNAMALEELEIIKEESGDDIDAAEKKGKSKRVLRFNVD